MDIQEVLEEVDNRPFLKFISDLVGEISSRDNSELAYQVIKLAVRCVTLLDLHAETHDSYYIEGEEGFEDQRESFYQLIPPIYRQEIRGLEEEISRFFSYESELIERIQKGDKFDEEDIRNYLEWKSSDSLFYGRLLEIISPRWNLTPELQLQTILFDIGKDIEDYETDVRNGLPNVLYMYLSGRLNENQIPHILQDAIDLGNELGFSDYMLSFASKIRNQILESPDVQRSVRFMELVKDRYRSILQQLEYD